MQSGRRVVASVECSLFQSGVLFQKPLSPKPGALSYPITTTLHSSFRWIRAYRNRPAVAPTLMALTSSLASQKGPPPQSHSLADTNRSETILPGSRSLCPAAATTLPAGPVTFHHAVAGPRPETHWPHHQQAVPRGLPVYLVNIGYAQAAAGNRQQAISSGLASKAEWRRPTYVTPDDGFSLSWHSRSELIRSVAGSSPNASSMSVIMTRAARIRLQWRKDA